MPGPWLLRRFWCHAPASKLGMSGWCAFEKMGSTGSVGLGIHTLREGNTRTVTQSGATLWTYAYDCADRMLVAVNPGLSPLFRTRSDTTAWATGSRFTLNMTGTVPGGSPNWLAPGYAGADGYQGDPDTGLMRAGSRYYNPYFGRWLTQDPAGAGDNWYAYCENEPIDQDDPTGLDYADAIRYGRSVGAYPGQPIYELQDGKFDGNVYYMPGAMDDPTYSLSLRSAPSAGVVTKGNNLKNAGTAVGALNNLVAKPALKSMAKQAGTAAAKKIAIRVGVRSTVIGADEVLTGVDMGAAAIILSGLAMIYDPNLFDGDHGPDDTLYAAQHEPTTSQMIGPRSSFNAGP